MKKTVRKILALALVFLLAFQLAGAASAATDNTLSWTSGGITYSAILTSSNDSNSYTDTAFVKFHNQGTATRITATTANTYYKSANTSLGYLYSGHISTLMTQVGYTDRAFLEVQAGAYVTVPSTAVSGNYCMTVKFPGSTVMVTVHTIKTDQNGNPIITTPTSYSSNYTPKSSTMHLEYRAN